MMKGGQCTGLAADYMDVGNIGCTFSFLHFNESAVVVLSCILNPIVVDMRPVRPAFFNDISDI